MLVRDGFALEGDGERLVARGIRPERVPDLVAALVRVHARVHSVEPAQETLEERFLALLTERGTLDERSLALLEDAAPKAMASTDEER